MEQSLLSRDSALGAMMEKGKILLSLLHSPSITENMDRLQSDYRELCNTARVRQAHTQTEEKQHVIRYISLYLGFKKKKKKVAMATVTAWKTVGILKRR